MSLSIKQRPEYYNAPATSKSTPSSIHSEILIVLFRLGDDLRDRDAR
jgi:hypothetical protein